MNNLETTEKEFRIINEIGKDLNITQREISYKSGISLGMTNIVLRRLIKKGYVKMRQLNKKNVQYLLTPKGFAQKARQSYHYTLETIQTFKTMKLKIQNYILQGYKNGHRKFAIYGDNEIADLIEISFHDLEKKKKDIVYKKVNGNDIALQNIIKDKNVIILLTQADNPPNIKGVDIISILS